jgi:septal ring factor EnvC (AmiA/AmiB activator)
MQDAIREVENKMAELKAQIDAVDARLAPLKSQREALAQEQILLAEQIDAVNRAIESARGDAQAWIDLKKEYGMLAATRMQMRSAAKSIA